MPKTRLDVLLVERGLVPSRSAAQRLVLAGQVRVNGQLALKPSWEIDPDSLIEIRQGLRYVSRGGEKLAAALDHFAIQVEGKVCVDVGASTGGFTDCLLQRGARRVYAIDVGKGVLAWKLRNDPRVVVMEDTNVRHVQRLPEPVQLVTVDVSFISLKVVLPVVRKWLEQEEEVAEVLALIKPQFEAGRREAARGAGVIRSPEIHQRVIAEIRACAEELAFQVRGVMESPLLGPKGNREFFLWLGWHSPVFGEKPEA
ncbi:MAG: TlyA family RNA methyltransferase [Anaerolineales bacterium]|nr:TlyA family RNA methyltransferase [Anaerolineales bacterium]MCS7248682.1 TlyA family RNA methyltransferase [Anaerolineales bacterium]MDW8162495.1 TlyA family RNA methyltransferase [Anaerolineales bacterium]MDW8447466.1 TlyA family RNA methyltransferase [Anaerolineales bacterium]